jgi:quinol monooxygenase YgiN
MAVLAMVRLKGAPAQLLDAKRRHMDPIAKATFAKHGHQWQVVVQDDSGLIVFNLWEDADGRDLANSEPEMQEARQRIVESTGATAEFADWPVIEHSVTRRTGAP